MLAGGIAIFLIFAFLGHRILTRILIPEFGEQPTGDRMPGDGDHMEHARPHTGTEA